MPEFVVERLRSAAVLNRASISAHPDANLVAAFLERSLREEERAQLLDHLSLCADCREVVARALPEEGTAAAAVAVLAVAVLVTKPFTGSGEMKIATSRASEQQAPPAASGPTSNTKGSNAPSEPTARVDRHAASSATRLAAEAKPGNSLKAAAVAAPTSDLIARAETAAGQYSQAGQASGASGPVAATPSAAPGYALPAGDVGSARKLLASRWMISESGKLLRAVGRGGWKPVALNDTAVFHAVATVGSNVWVGGNAGVLYHSADFGDHWQPVLPWANGARLQQDISQIEFDGPGNGTLKTAGGEIWTTSDAGQSWQKH